MGTVRDAAGAGIPGATIAVRNLTTNQTRNVTSEADGSYRATALAVGDYEVKAQGTGFAPYFNPKVTVALGRSTTLDLSLTTGDVNAQVTVTDSPPALDAAQTAVTTSIDPERIEELPVNSRNYLQFTLLAPGVAPSNQQNSGGSNATSGAPLADSGFTFGGLRPRSNSISIDGLDNTDETTGAARVALSPEIVREFQIVNNGQSAEFGGAAGGAINVVTRVGQNQFHGDAFTFFQNERFNAREPFSDPPPASRLRFRRVQPGVALGGPLKRDKFFFYVAAEQEHLSAEDESEINRSARTRINTLLASGFAPRLAVRSLTGGRFRIGTDETEAAAKVTDYQFTASAISVLSPTLVNDVRFQASTRRAVTRAGDAFGPEVEIVGIARFGRAFDADSTRKETREQFVDNISLSHARSEWKGGVTINHVALNSEFRDGFGALYIFRTLDDFGVGRPAIWRQAFGSPATQFGVTSFGAFLQNQWRVTPQLTLNLGGRYDVEQLPSLFRTDKNNFSPRLGLAWSPSKEWVVRGGFGLSYDRLPLAFLNQAIQKNGVQSFEQVATDGNAAAIFALTSGGRALTPFTGIAPSIFRADPKFVAPYSFQANAGVERLLSKDVTVRADYLFTRGVHLPRTRNVNLLPPVVLTDLNAPSLGFLTPTSRPTPQQLGRLVFGPGRIDPRFDAIYQLEDSATSTLSARRLGYVYLQRPDLSAQQANEQ